MRLYFKSDWQLRAVCGDADPRLFEVPNNQALATCAQCPVIAECWAHAMASPWQPYGVWGGRPPKVVTRSWRERHPRASRAEVEELMGVVG